MANTIRIKRRSADSTAPTTSQAVNGELAFNENNEVLYYGKGGTSSASSSVIKIGGSGAYLTTDTNQTPTGTKTFSTSTLKITGGSSNYVLSTDGSGNLSWASVSANAYSNITDGTTTAAASGADTVKFRATSPLTVTVGSNDLTHGDNVLYAVNAASTSASGVVQLTDSTSTTSSTLAATATAVKSAYDLANAALPKSGGTMTGYITLHADPSSSSHAATKNYVDSVAQGLHVHAVADAGTTAKLATLAGVAVSYSSGTQAITWTGGTAANAAGFTDGVTLTANTTEASASRILVKNEGDAGGLGAAYNGTYYVYGARELRRTTDGNTAADYAGGDFCYIVNGTIYEATGWVQTEKVVTLDTTPIIWQQFSGAGTITAGNGLTASGTTIDVGTASTARIVVNADNIDLATVSQSNTSGTAGINFVQSHTVDSYGRVSATVSADVRTGSTSQTGILQLTDSVSSTSTTTAATPNSVKTSYDLANAALPKSGGTMTGKLVATASTTSIASIQLQAGVDPSLPQVGDIWFNSSSAVYRGSTAGSNVKTFAFVDSTMTGTWNGNTIGTSYGGTGLTSFTSGGAVYATSTSALTTGTLPVASGGTGITSFGTGVATWLGTPSSANLAAAITDETGSGVLVFGTGPTISLPIIDNIKIGYTSTATAAGTTTLTSSSNYRQFFTGTSTQTVTLPVATTMVNGQSFEIHNNSTGVVTVQTSGLNTLIAVNGGQTVLVTCINTAGGTGTASWDYDITGASTSTGSGSLVYSTSPTLVTPVLGTPASGNLSNCTNIPVNQATGTLATTNGGTGLTSFTSGGAVYATSTSALTTGTLPVGSGGTGLSSYTTGGLLYASGSSVIAQTTGSSYDSTNGVGTILSVNVSGIPTWTNTVDGGGY